MKLDITDPEYKRHRRALINLQQQQAIMKARVERRKKKYIPPLPLHLQNYCPICKRSGVKLTKHHYLGRKFKPRRVQWVCKRCHELHNKVKGPYGKIVNDYYKSI